MIEFTTSKGIVRGTLKEDKRGHLNGSWYVEFDEINTKILQELYIFVGGVYNPNTGWIKIELDDGFYGIPEYKAQIVKEAV